MNLKMLLQIVWVLQVTFLLHDTLVKVQITNMTKYSNLLLKATTKLLPP